MGGENNGAEWIHQFGIQSTVDLDFVIGQDGGWPVGMQRSSPPELRRRLLAAAISYQARLKSIDYTLKNYVDPNAYQTEDVCLGDIASDFLCQSLERLRPGLQDLHTQKGLTFGIFGAELTLFRVPDCLDNARMQANRGLFLEVIPLLRLCLEMTAWSAVAFFTEREAEVRNLKAQHCIPRMKSTYRTVGKLYGYLCNFSHWNFEIHPHFMAIIGENTGS